MNVLNGIQNFLGFINANWTTIVVIVGLTITVYRKAKNFFSKSNDEKVLIAKQIIKEGMLELVTNAEKDYKEWVKAGAIKRAKVINQIFAEYPILHTVTNQEELIAWIDDMINAALDEMRKIFAENLENQ